MAMGNYIEKPFDLSWLMRFSTHPFSTSNLSQNGHSERKKKSKPDKWRAACDVEVYVINGILKL